LVKTDGTCSLHVGASNSHPLVSDNTLPETLKLSMWSSFSLVGVKNAAKLALNGEVVTLDSLRKSGFPIKKSGVNHGNGEICLICAPKGSGQLRIWYEVTSINCNKVSGAIWICSHCSKVYVHDSRGTALWAELVKGLASVEINHESDNDHAHISSSFLPNKDNFELAYRMLTNTGETLSIDSVLDLIETNAMKGGYSLKNNWRMITEKNIEIWSNKL
jgi:hypothetical protein